MRKIISLISTLLLICSITSSVEAQENLQKVGEGYTTDGVYYEVFAVDDEDISLCATSISVTRQMKYNGIVTPSAQISWEEEINGVNYTGVLKLSSYAQSSGQTIATYKGTLYAVE